jgi:ferritin-like protein
MKNNKKRKLTESFLYDPVLEKKVRGLIADEYIAWQEYFLMKHALLEDKSEAAALFLKNADDELNDHYEKLVNWAKASQFKIPVTLSEIRDSANSPFIALSQDMSVFDFIKIAIKSEELAISAYADAIEFARMTNKDNSLQELLVILYSNYGDEKEHREDLQLLKEKMSASLTSELKSGNPVETQTGSRAPDFMMDEYGDPYQDNEDDDYSGFNL